MKTSLTLLAICLVLCTAFVVENIIGKLGLQEDAAKKFILRDFIGDFSTGAIEESGAVEDNPDY